MTSQPSTQQASALVLGVITLCNEHFPGCEAIMLLKDQRQQWIMGANLDEVSKIEAAYTILDNLIKNFDENGGPP